MGKLVGILLVAGGLAAAVAFLPLRGRTVLDRWQSAPSAGQFAARSWREVAVVAGLEHPPARRPAAPRTPPAQAPRTAPSERHTDADRAALERVVSEHAGSRR